VHQRSISMLVRVLGFPVFKPEVDLGLNADQTAMGLVFNESEFARHVMYQPGAWFNTYHNREGWEGEAGDILVHFPGLDEMRSPKMQSWWATINDPVLSKQYIVPLAKTTYRARIARFWETMREGRAMIRMVEDYVDAHLGSPSTYVDSVKEELVRLVFAVEQESNRPMAVEAAMERMQILYAEGLKWGHEYEEAREVVPRVPEEDVAAGGTEGDRSGDGTDTGTDAAAGTSEDSDQPIEIAG
jgi:hypothetical protein